MKEENKITPYWTCFVYLVVAVLIFLLTKNTIWILDDITYQYNFATGERINSIRDIFESQYAHYFSWNGRVVAHWLCQLFLPILGKTAFAVTNAVLYLLLIALIVKIDGSRLDSLSSTLKVALFVLFFSDTVYTPPCQIGYVWMAVLVLWFLWIFFGYAQRSSHNVLSLILVSFVSLMAGNAHESINIGVGGALLIYCLCSIRKLTLMQWLMTIGFGIGGLFLCLSPGSLGNAESRHVSVLYSLLHLFTDLRMTYIFVLLFIYSTLTKKITIKEFYFENSFYINAMIILFAFDAFIGFSVNRQLWGIELFACILSIKLLRLVNLRCWVYVVAVIVIGGLYYVKGVEIQKMKQSYSKIVGLLKGFDPKDPLFIDFPSQCLWVHPTSYFVHGWYLNYCTLTAYIVANDEKVFRHHDIKAYPTISKDIFNSPVKNQAYEYLPGQFILLQDKENPVNFRLNRQVSLMGLKISLPPYDVPFDSSSILSTPQYNVVIIPKTMPLIDNVTIEIKSNI